MESLANKVDTLLVNAMDPDQLLDTQETAALLGLHPSLCTNGGAPGGPISSGPKSAAELDIGAPTSWIFSTRRSSAKALSPRVLSDRAARSRRVEAVGASPLTAGEGIAGGNEVSERYGVDHGRVGPDQRTLNQLIRNSPPMRTDQQPRPAPVTTRHFSNPPVNRSFPGINTEIRIDRIRYWAERRHLTEVQRCLGPVVRLDRTLSHKATTHCLSSLTRDVHVSTSRRNPFAKILIDVDDPTASDQKVLLRLLNTYLPQGAFGHTEVEIAVDLEPERPETLTLLKEIVLGHLVLPYARRPPRVSAGGKHAIDGTWYFGSRRRGPRFVKVYEKRLGADAHSDVVRIEWTIHGRFQAYGIPRIGVIRLHRIRFDRLFQWRRVDYHRMAELAYRRWASHAVPSSDPYAGVTIAHWRNQLRAEFEPEQGPDHVNLIMQIMHDYRKSEWYRLQDMNQVFPHIV